MWFKLVEDISSLSRTDCKYSSVTKSSSKSGCTIAFTADSIFFSSIGRIINSYAKTNLEHPIRFLDDPVLAFDKFIILTDTNSDIDLFHTKLKDNFDFIIREEMHPYGFEEIVPKGCSKASGIDFIVKHLKASLDDCYVFGDSTNDLSMLTHVKNSIAMGNAYPEVLRNTSYVTTPIDRDGIRNALKHFKLISFIFIVYSNISLLRRMIYRYNIVVNKNNRP